MIQAIKISGLSAPHNTPTQAGKGRRHEPNRHRQRTIHCFPHGEGGLHPSTSTVQRPTPGKPEGTTAQVEARSHSREARALRRTPIARATGDGVVSPGHPELPHLRHI